MHSNMRFSDYIYFFYPHSSFLSQDCDSLHLYNKSFKDLIVLKEDYKIRFSKNERGFENV